MDRRLSAIAVAFALLLSNGSAWAGRLHPEVDAQLAGLPPGRTLSVIVEMVRQADPAAAAATAPGRQRAARRRAVRDFLRDLANLDQRAIRSVLAQEHALGTARRVVPLWILNGLAITATEPVIRRLAARPDVWEIRPDGLIRLPAPVSSTATPSATTVEWNIAQIRAPEVWALDPAYTGAGVVVGSFDTGVDLTHPDLEPRYRGNHAISWFDPYGEHDQPVDAHGHGTHTTGIIVGGDASGTSIGVAPGARWIAAKAWNDQGVATVSAFHQIFEWFLAPGGDPANAPDVVNSSWGFAETGCITEFQADVEALRAAGIFPTFATGNSGPGPGSVGSPGANPETFAVGATDFFDDVAFFSSRGPSPCNGIVKPDLSAPGVDILSSLPGGEWFPFSGTSMAAPHVTGAVAVLRAIDPTLTVDELESVLTLGAVDLGPTGPDNDFGLGRLDLFQSAQIVLGGVGRPIVSITAMGTATEAGLAPATLRVSRTGSTEAPLTVHYTVNGTATAGLDYVALPTSVTIPEQSTTVTIAIMPLDDSLVELDETVTLALSIDAAYIVGRPGDATITVVSDEVPPDLTVASVTAPGAVGAGTPFDVSDTTTNRGGGPADSSTIILYLSTDAIYDPADLPLASRAVPALAPGASSSGSVSITLPAGTAGAFYLLARADATSVLTESDESNNVAARRIDVGPDLLVSSLVAPSGVGAGVSFTVTETTANQAGASADASTTTFYLSRDAVLDATDTLLGSRPVPALAAGTNHTAATTVTVPAGTAAGSYYVLARADAANVIAEVQEGNNLRSRAIQLGADLWVSSLMAPTLIGLDTPFTVTDTTTNQGGGPAGASTTTFYLSLDIVVDATDTLLGSRSVPALAAGASHSAATTVTIPATTAAGSYYVLAHADATNVVAEAQEANNGVQRRVHLGPDLTVSGLTVPAMIATGVPFAASDTTVNRGGGSAPASTTTFYLSSNPTLDAGDLLLASRLVPVLAAGATSTASITLTIPAGTPPGTHYLLVHADAASGVDETQETNNVFSRAIALGPDLAVSSLTVPVAIDAGTPFTITDTTANQGGGLADASTTTFYLSRDAVLDGTDTLLGSRPVPALGAGANHSAGTTITIPVGTAVGSYYVLARADAANVISEVQEGNNLRSRAIQFGADLWVSSLMAPTLIGTLFTVNDTTANQGSGLAEASTTTFYLSRDAVFDAADTLLGSHPVPALAAGTSHSAATSVTIPAGTAAGSYYVLARADATHVVAETNEANNVVPRRVHLGPDLIVSGVTVPATIATGVQFAASDTTVNRGGGSAPASTTSFYLSSNPTLDAGDLLLASRLVPSLAAGATSTASLTLTIPVGTASGTYYLLVHADATSGIEETQETNNVLARTIAVSE